MLDRDVHGDWHRLAHPEPTEEKLAHLRFLDVPVFGRQPTSHGVLLELRESDE